MFRSKCIHSLNRSFATEATLSSSLSSTPSQSKSKTPPFLQTSVIVNRSPTISKTLSAFERKFYEYQSRIARTLHNPFPNEFYFKQGSPLESQFKLEERKREMLAFGSISKYMRKVTEANKEVVELAKEEIEPAAPRTTEADKKKDFHSLDRQGERNLYLIIKKKAGDKTYWSFPEGSVQKSEFLHDAAERVLTPECGVNMDTWMVSRKPIGLYQPPIITPTAQQTITFFYKMHILAGQVRPNGISVLDFAWLTKEEIETHIERDYWSAVKDMLSDF